MNNEVVADAGRPARRTPGPRTAAKARRFNPPWRDRHGRLVPIKVVCFPLMLLPALVLVFQYLSGDLGARALDELIHGAGLWTIRFTLIALAITPMRNVLDWPKIVLVRRMVGVTAMTYGLVHLALYATDQKFHMLHVASEIALRFYLTIGFIALCGLVALGATSTDGAVRRMGKNWKRLHLLIFPILVLGLLHYFMQSKADVYSATLAAGLFLWMVLWRLVPSGWRGSPGVLFGLAAGAALLTVGTEAAWYGLATRIKVSRVLAANLDFEYELRPAVWVALVALALAVVATAIRVIRARGGNAPRLAPRHHQSP